MFVCVRDGVKEKWREKTDEYLRRQSVQIIKGDIITEYKSVRRSFHCTRTYFISYFCAYKFHFSCILLTKCN